MLPHDDRIRRANQVIGNGGLQQILPDETMKSTLWPGNELVLPHSNEREALFLIARKKEKEKAVS